MPRRLTRRYAGQLAFLALACIAATGCGSILEGQDNGPPPDPTASQIVNARRSATSRADAALGDVAGALEGRIIAQTTADGCYPGQNNYKVHDGYDHRCTLRRAVVVGFDGDFRKRIALFDQRLFAAGWGCGAVPCEETHSDLVREYWDFRKPEYGGDDPPISILPTTSFYQRHGLYLEVDYVSGSHPSGRYTLEDWHRRRRGGGLPSFERSRPFDADAALVRVRRFDYAVALAVEIDYFEDTEIG